MKSKSIISICLLICESFIFLGCSDNGQDRVKDVATRQLIKSYGHATRAALRDCGSGQMRIASYPSVFFKNPGWKEWRGPYLLGNPRNKDYFDIPITFSISNDQLKIVSAGRDGIFENTDDVIEVVRFE